MLNLIEKSDVMQFIDTIEDEHIKELLNNMQFEYDEYTKIGTVEEVGYYKALCNTKPIEFANFTRDVVHHFKNELAFERRNKEKPKRKRGRPKLRSVRPE